jgi:hypothetical protein
MLQVETASYRESDRLRTMGFVEVVDIAPVARRFPLTSPFGKEPLHHRMFAKASRAKREQVVRIVLDFDTEAERRNRSALTEETIDRRQLACVLEWQIVDVAASAKTVVCQRFDRRQEQTLPHHRLKPSIDPSALMRIKADSFSIRDHAGETVSDDRAEGASP